MENKFEIGETSKEILFEWYKERGVSPEELEEMERRRKEEEGDTMERFSSSGKQPPTMESLKEKEDKKKLQVKEEVKELLTMVEGEGLEKAIKKARKKKDPFLLDIFHDILAKDGAYKKLIEE